MVSAPGLNVTPAKMFILFGYPRSGNTLLGAVLNANDHIAVPEETDFIVPVCVICKRVPDPSAGRALLAKLITSTERFEHSLAKYASYSDLEEALENCEYTAAAVINAVFQVVARNAGKLVAGDRSPNDIAYIPDMMRSGLFKSDIRVIHLVRDPRDVYLSTRRLNWIPENQLRSGFPGTWSATNAMLYDLFRNAQDRYLSVRYEDLIAEPEMQVRRITDFLGVPFQSKMLDPSTRSGLYQGVVHHVNVSREFLTSPVRAYMRELPRQLAHEIATKTAATMTIFGYDEEFTPAPAAAFDADNQNSAVASGLRLCESILES